MPSRRAGLKPAILEVLEKHRDEELAERREKRRRLQQQEASSSQPAASSSAAGLPPLAPATVRADEDEDEGDPQPPHDGTERTVTLLGPWPSSTAATPASDTSHRNIPPADLEDVMAAASSLAAYASPPQQQGAHTGADQPPAPQQQPASEAGERLLVRPLHMLVCGGSLCLTVGGGCWSLSTFGRRGWERWVTTTTLCSTRSHLLLSPISRHFVALVAPDSERSQPVEFL